MYDPSLKNDIQSVNYKPESKPGAGDGTGWRLCKNGDFQIGTMSMIDGVIRNPHATVHIDRAMVDSASIKPAQLDLPIHQVHGDRARAQSEIEIRMTVGDGGALPDMNEEQRAHLHEKIRRLVTDAAGVSRYAITEEVTVRAEADTALASRIGAINVDAWAGVGASLDLQLGKEYLAIPQPGGDVTLGRLGGKPVGIKDLVETMGRVASLGMSDKPGCIPHEFAGGLLRDPLKGSYRDIEPTKEFLAENVRSDLTPQAACALSMCAPITGNGKVPVNNLPHPVDDDK